MVLYLSTSVSKKLKDADDGNMIDDLGWIQCFSQVGD
uniref:Uncharacterized protein n=1 Tax=Rhizophora mucronata TaxID=61149 RepID=A0A2P2PQD6_RHIMU